MIRPQLRAGQIELSEQRGVIAQCAGVEHLAPDEPIVRAGTNEDVVELVRRP